MEAVLSEYLWLVVAGALVAFGFGYGTGANDVANAFGTSVGAKTLTLKQAVLIASVFELAGALTLGRVSTNTIAAGVADINSFTNYPEVYAYGMVCALGVGTIWLLITSYLGLNVSSTHCIVGGIIGFALVWDGKDAVLWAKKDHDHNRFPPYNGVIAIVLSWFIAPLLSAFAAAVIFFVVRTLVLRRRNAYALSFWMLPLFLFVCTFTNMYFVFTKGIKKTLSSSDWPDAKAAWVSASIAGGATVLCIFVAVPVLKNKADKHFDSDGKAIEPMPNALSPEAGYRAEMIILEQNATDAEVDAVGVPMSVTRWQKISNAAMHGLNVDIHKVVETDEKIGGIHENAECFQAGVEYSFSHLQIFSAICVSFAHGAGEVGYMAGPLATIWDVYKKGQLSSSVKPPIWIVLICAIGLVIGLATYGYNVTRAMGVKLAKITPTRGFAAELATAVVIMISSQYGLPCSSSQCITGAIIGVGLLEGAKGVNWTQFVKQFFSWVATLLVIGLIVAAVFAQGIYSPSKFQASEVTLTGGGF